MKRTRHMTLLALTFFLNGPALAQTPAALKELDVFAGTWTFAWTTRTSIFGPAATISGTERFEWLPGRFFLRMDREAKTANGAFSNLGLLSYDSESKAYTQRIFNLSNGWAAVFAGTRTGNDWTWSGSGSFAGTSFQERCVWTIGTGGATRTVKCEVSTDSGKTWSITEEGQYKKSP